MALGTVLTRPRCHPTCTTVPLSHGAGRRGVLAVTPRGLGAARGARLTAYRGGEGMVEVTLATEGIWTCGVCFTIALGLG